MKEQRNPNRRSRGFSLAEVLVAVALLSVILLALFGLVTGGVRRAYGGKKMTEGAVLAYAILQRANTAAPQTLLDGAAGDTTRTQTWTKTSDAVITEAAEGTGTPAKIERDVWRSLLLNSKIPTSATAPAKLVVTMTALPAGRTFGTVGTEAAIVRVQVEVSWSEWGSRPRVVRLQTFNVRSTTI
jgi:prepilin-type N-terminal cleavage/methylation domain-containing protein